jgi:hypothetical protein
VLCAFLSLLSAFSLRSFSNIFEVSNLFFSSDSHKGENQQGLQHLTSALDKALQADTAENTSYKSIDVVCNIISLLGPEYDT